MNADVYSLPPRYPVSQRKAILRSVDRFSRCPNALFFLRIRLLGLLRVMSNFPAAALSFCPLLSSSITYARSLPPMIISSNIIESRQRVDGTCEIIASENERRRAAGLYGSRSPSYNKTLDCT